MQPINEKPDEQGDQGEQDTQKVELEATRRTTLLSVLIGSGAALVAGILGIPAMLALGTPALRRRRREPWRSVGRLEEFPQGDVRKAVVQVDRVDWARSLEEKAVYVWRRADDDLVVYSRDCTDLSCPVHFDMGSRYFYCPCHGGIFDIEGTPMAGPPSRPLDRYATRIRHGVIEIDLDSLGPIS